MMAMRFLPSKKTSPAARKRRLRWIAYSSSLVVIYMISSFQYATAVAFFRHPPPESTVYQRNNGDQYHGSSYHHHHPQYEYSYDARGGSTQYHQHQEQEWAEPASPPPPPPTQEESPTFRPPKISLTQLEMTLRLTAEWNRRLLQGVSQRLFPKSSSSSSSRQEEQEQPLTPQERSLSRRGGTSTISHPVNVHPSQTWHEPIRNEIAHEVELTIFDAKEPRRTGGADDTSLAPRRGAARWGPQLLPYLQHVADLLDISEEDGAVEIPLAMMYMDRACSVETPRSNGIVPCPYCTPRSVHRLSLIALILATQAVNGGSLDDYYAKVESLGIPKEQLQQMCDWMRGAMGDEGLIVTVGQMKEWTARWDAIFNPLPPTKKAEEFSSATSTLDKVLQATAPQQQYYANKNDQYAQQEHHHSQYHHQQQPQYANVPARPYF